MAPEVERRALAMVERIAANPGNARLEERLLRREPESVRARVAALLRQMDGGRSLLPTELPGVEISDDGWVPERIGAYRLSARLGRGGMGEVWRAERDDGLYQQAVAIKLLQPGVRLRGGAAFEAERRLLARLEHTHIARLLDGGVTDTGVPWLMTEFVAGVPLDEAATGLAARDKVALFRQVAEAVQFAHAKRVVHGDIKPANILVDNRRAKLLDFGIGALIGGDSPHAAAGAMTQGFASPERVAGEGVSVADDVYALGRTLALLLGDTPDADLGAIARQATAPANTDRYGSAAELIADLDRWREKLPVKARASTPRYRAGKFLERHWKGVGMATAAMLLLAGTASVATFASIAAERQRAKAEARFDEVRQLARYQLFDLYERLRAAPGTVAIRADLAAKSAAYLDRLRALPNPPPGLARETAAGYRRLARVQGAAGTASLGRPVAALRSLAIAEQLLRQIVADNPRDAGALEELGWTQVDRWTFESNAADANRALSDQAAHSFSAALAIEPARVGAQLGLLAVERQRAFSLVSDDQPGKAVPIANAALAALERLPPDSKYAEDRALLRIGLLMRLADAHYYTEDVAGALVLYRRVEALIEQHLRNQGDAPDWLSRLGEAEWNISAATAETNGDLVAAQAAAAKGIAAYRRILAFGPDDQAEKGVFILYGQEALNYDQAGRHADAVAMSQQSVAIRETRYRRAPGDPTRRRDLAISLVLHAELLTKAGRRAQACSTARSVMKLWQRMDADKQLGARDRRVQLPRAQKTLATTCGAG